MILQISIFHRIIIQDIAELHRNIWKIQSGIFCHGVFTIRENFM